MFTDWTRTSVMVPATPPRPLIIRARRDTIVLVAVACGATFLLAYGVHSRQVAPSSAVVTSTPSKQQQQDWTGHLAEVAAVDAAPGPVEPLSSASLVVPKAQLALPPSPVRAVKAKACEGSACPAKTAPVPARRANVANQNVQAEQASHESTPKPSLIATLNPLNHMPSLSTIRRPFAYAGDTVSGWIKRF